jgi:PD-(D/E)XK endonuclease
MGLATRGNEAEAVILAAMVKRGFHLLTPFGSGQPYDLVVDLGRAAFLRVQCKTAWSRPGCLTFNCRATDHGRGPRSYSGLADVFGVYFPPDGSTYLVPVQALTGFEGRLRLEPTRNNQRKGIRFAADFVLSGWSHQSLLELVPGRGSEMV